MRVLIDALSARFRGGQTYLINLLAHLPRDGTVEVLLLAPESLRLAGEHPHIRRPQMPRALENPFVRAVWQRFRVPALAKAFNADIVFFPGGIVSCTARGCSTVTMFRNMIPFDLEQRRRYPLGYQRFRNWLLQPLMLKSMLRADLVILISEYAKRVVETAARGAPLRSVVIPHGIAQQFKATSQARDASLPAAGSYLLYVSYVDFYKAQLEVVQAYAELKRLRAIPQKLLLVGEENPVYGARVRALIAQLGLTDDVVLTGPLPYACLPDLYRGATIKIFASESENCPNILLEAMAIGRPVVCSNREPMPEFAQDGVEYFDPRQPSTLVAALTALLDNTEVQRALGERAKAQAARYDWAITARRTWDAMADTVAARRRDVSYRSLENSR